MEDSVKTVTFTIAILIASVGFANGKGKKISKPSSKVSSKLSSKLNSKVQPQPVAKSEPKLQKASIQLKVVRTKKSRADLSDAISESFQGRKEIQQGVQTAAGIEKVSFEPSPEAYKIEAPTSLVSTASEDVPEAKFVAPPRRGPASDTNGLLKEVDESEKAD